MSLRVRFGQNLAYRRNKRNLTQEQLSRKSHIHQVTLSRIETWLANSGLDTLEALANALDIDPVEFLKTTFIKPKTDPVKDRLKNAGE